MEYEVLLEVAGSIEEALNSDLCWRVQHASANALGQIRFRTGDGRVFEIDLTTLKEFPEWHSQTPL